MDRLAPALFDNRLRRFTSLAAVAAATLRSRRHTPVVEAAPVPQIIANPEQLARDSLVAAYDNLRQADSAATDAELFRRLRLLVNRLENGGLPPRRAPAALAQQPTPAPPVSKTPTRRRDALMSSLREGSRLLRHTLRGT